MDEPTTLPPQHPSRAFLERCEAVIDELHELVREDILHQAIIIPYPLRLRYGIWSLNQPLWEKLPEVMHLIQTEETTLDASREYQMQFLLKEVMAHMVRRCAYVTSDKGSLTIPESTIAAMIAPTPLEELKQLAENSTNHTNEKSNDDTATRATKR